MVRVSSPRMQHTHLAAADCASRRALLLAATAACSPPPLRVLAAAAPLPFELTLPSGFVRVGNLGSGSRDAGVLFVAGDYSTTIASGGATTLSVQRLRLSETLPPPTSDTAARLAMALAQLRDRDATNPAPSQVLPETVVADGPKLTFEMLTALTGGDPRTAPPKLVRHTLVQAQLAPDGLFVLWAGAQQVDWDLGAADRLRTAASTFSLRTPP